MHYRMLARGARVDEELIKRPNGRVAMNLKEQFDGYWAMSSPLPHVRSKKSTDDKQMIVALWLSSDQARVGSTEALLG